MADAGIRGRRVALLGAGGSNRAALRYVLTQSPAAVEVFDTRAEIAPGIPGEVRVTLGALSAKRLKEFDLLVLSPGLSAYLPEITEAAAAGAEVAGDVELFARTVHAPIVGITGSNGKSTVTAMVHDMARNDGITAAIGANFGTAVFDLPRRGVELYVLELSSFELESVSTMSLLAGCCLNVSEDHLDRYAGDIEKYAAAKRRIYERCEKIVINREDLRTYPERGAAVYASFGAAGGSMGPRDYWLKDSGAGTMLCAGTQEILPASELSHFGRHNELNALAALALAEAAGISREAACRTLATLPVLEHRLHLVQKVAGVSYYNDSKATNVGSVEAALAAVGPRHPAGVILLCGGLGKGQDFTPLRRYFGTILKRAFCFGADRRALLALSDRCAECTDLQEAFKAAAAAAEPGQAVLLSPGCASFDQFSGFAARGEAFERLVRTLAGGGSAA